MSQPNDPPDEWSVYHRDNAGQPEAHQGDGPWYFQPVGYDGDVYSRGYGSRAAAVEACWEHHAEELAEESRAQQQAIADEFWDFYAPDGSGK